VIGDIVVIALAEINGFGCVFSIRSLTETRERIFICIPECDALERKTPLDQNTDLPFRRLLPIKEKQVTTELIKSLVLDALPFQHELMSARLMRETAHHE
jgi:hypothetical protein